MSNELESIWKEVVMAKLRYCPAICLKGGKPVRISRVQAKIQTKHLPHTSLKHCPYTNLLSGKSASHNVQII
jgi:hypothetical protein